MFQSAVVRLALWSYDHAKLFFCILLAALGLSFWLMQSLHFDMSNEGTLRESNPIRAEYTKFREQFGRDDFVLVLIDLQKATADHGGLGKALHKIEDLRQNIEGKVPYLDEVTAITDIRYTHTQDGAMRVDGLLSLYDAGYWPSDAAFLDFIAQHPLYKNRMISEDKQFVALTVLFKSTVAESDALLETADDGSTVASNSEASTDTLQELDLSDFDMDAGTDVTTDTDSSAVSEFAAKQQKVDSLMLGSALNTLREEVAASGFATHITGSPYVVDEFGRVTNIGSAITGTIGMTITLVLLWVFFRRASAVFIPLSIVPLSMLIPLGVQAALDIPYTLYSGIVVPLMVAIGVADGVHILSRFYEHYDQYGDKREAIRYAMESTGTAVLLTSVTTAIGFMAFTIGDLAAIATLGVFAAGAILTAFLLSILYVPACIRVFRIRKHEQENRVHGALEGLLTKAMSFSLKYKKVVSAVAVLAFIALSFNLQNLRFAYNVVESISPGVVQTDYYRVNDIMKTVNPVEVVIDTGEEDGATRLELLQAVDAAEQELAESVMHGVQLSRPYSVTAIVKEVNSALNDNQIAHYTLPDSTDAVRQELSLFESNARDDLFDAVDERFQKMRVTLQVSNADSYDYYELLPKIEAVFRKHLGDKVGITMTGDTALVAGVLQSTSTTMIKSYTISFLVITLLLVVLTRSLKIGVLSMIPNILPIWIVLNIMVLMGRSLDLTTIMIGVIAIGIVVDDTLHMLHRYQENRKGGMDVEAAFMGVIPTTGKSLLITTILYASAAFNNVFSSVPGFITFGVAVSTITVIALFSDLLLLPALVATFSKKEKS